MTTATLPGLERGTAVYLPLAAGSARQRIEYAISIGEIVVQHDLAMTGAAWFSRDMRYRYLLRYALTGSVLEPPANPYALLMNNPSTADAFAPDPTLRRGKGFGRDMGHSDLIVANAHGWRSKDPDDLLRVADPVGPWNDAFLEALNQMPVVAGWGSHKAPMKRAAEVVRIIGRPLLCFRRSEKTGQPEHPLYLPASLRPIPWAPRKTA